MLQRLLLRQAWLLLYVGLRLLVRSRVGQVAHMLGDWYVVAVFWYGVFWHGAAIGW